MKWWKQIALLGALTTIPIFATDSSHARVLELAKNDPAFSDIAFTEEGTTPRHALKYARYLVLEFMGSIETVRGDYYCYVSTIASHEEQLLAIEALSVAGFALAQKKSNAVAVASDGIAAHRCHAPSIREQFELKLTGMVYLVRSDSSSTEPFEAIVLEGEATLDGIVQKIFVTKIRQLPTVS